MEKTIFKSIQRITSLQKLIKEDYKDSERDQNYVGLNGGTLADFESTVNYTNKKLEEIKNDLKNSTLDRDKKVTGNILNDEGLKKIPLNKVILEDILNTENNYLAYTEELLNWYQKYNKIKPIDNYYSLIKELIECKEFEFLNVFSICAIIDIIWQYEYIECCNYLLSVNPYLKNFKIPNNIVGITYECFEGYQLKELVIPEKIEYMDIFCFAKATIDHIILLNTFSSINSVPLFPCLSLISSNDKFVNEYCKKENIKVTSL